MIYVSNQPKQGFLVSCSGFSAQRTKFTNLLSSWMGSTRTASIFWQINKEVSKRDDDVTTKYNFMFYLHDFFLQQDPWSVNDFNSYLFHIAGIDGIFMHEFAVVVSPMVTQKLFSLQIDIDALNHRSPLIVYFWGMAVSKFWVPKTYLIGFSYLSFVVCFYFHWLLLAHMLGFPLWDASWSMPSLFASSCPHCLGILDIVTGGNLHPVWDQILLCHHTSASLPSNPFVY